MCKRRARYRVEELLLDRAVEPFNEAVGLRTTYPESGARSRRALRSYAKLTPQFQGYLLGQKCGVVYAQALSEAPRGAPACRKTPGRCPSE